MQRALKRCIERLRMEKGDKPPPTGVIILSSHENGIFYLVPNRPIQNFLYFCDKKFHLDEVMILFEEEEEEKCKDAIILVGGEDATLFHYDCEVD